VISIHYPSSSRELNKNCSVLFNDINYKIRNDLKDRLSILQLIRDFLNSNKINLNIDEATTKFRRLIIELDDYRDYELQ